MVRGLFGLALSAAALLAMAAPAAAQDAPSGTVEIASKNIGIGIGASWGDGTLTLPDGTKHKFSIESWKFLAAGASFSDTTGTVYDLKQVRDLEGTYVAGEAGLAVIGGLDGVTMKNEKGVVINFWGAQWGANFTLGGASIAIKLKALIY